MPAKPITIGSTHFAKKGDAIAFYKGAYESLAEFLSFPRNWNFHTISHSHGEATQIQKPCGRSRMMVTDLKIFLQPADAPSRTRRYWANVMNLTVSIDKGARRHRLSSVSRWLGNNRSHN
ncbi:hypothetical protein AB4043_19220 [Terriglobus sp. YAF25]|uniref:hypothetical protein n=1 Tax=Terriglobus sp. YAF25 TaxID=3233080 RepID=UPI003F95167C